jgi:hypothetical protein
MSSERKKSGGRGGPPGPGSSVPWIGRPFSELGAGRGAYLDADGWLRIGMVRSDMNSYMLSPRGARALRDFLCRELGRPPAGEAVSEQTRDLPGDEVAPTEPAPSPIPCGVRHGVARGIRREDHGLRSRPCLPSIAFEAGPYRRIEDADASGPSPAFVDWALEEL